MEKISFVIPCYRSEKTIKKVVDEIVNLMEQHKEYGYEVVLVNDCSPDNVWETIKELRNCYNNKIRAYSFSKNFGQAAAVICGFSHVSGDYIVSIDDDGQSPIDATFPALEYLKENNFDVVYGIAEEAKHSLFRRLGSKVNSYMAKLMFDRPTDKRIVNFTIFKRFVVEEMTHYNHSYTYISGLVYRSTQNVGYLKVNHRQRISGSSGYSWKKLISVWVNGFTAFSIKPLRLASYLGILVAIIGFIFGIITLIRKLVNPAIAVGWSSIMMVMLILLVLLYWF